MMMHNPVAADTALQLYSDCVRWLLLVAGGYECQEAEGTFMIAFASADAALEWCLMTQQVLRDMNWPQRWVAWNVSKTMHSNLGCSVSCEWPVTALSNQHENTALKASVAAHNCSSQTANAPFISHVVDMASDTFKEHQRHQVFRLSVEATHTQSHP